MASMRERNGRWQVRWRQDGRARAETFPNRAQARQFQGLVIAAGERYPQGWVPGHGFVAGDPGGSALPSPGPTGTLGAVPAPNHSVELAGAPALAAWFERAVQARTTANERSKADMRRDFRRHVPAWLASIPVDRITREGPSGEAQAGAWRALRGHFFSVWRPLPDRVEDRRVLGPVTGPLDAREGSDVQRRIGGNR